MLFLLLSFLSLFVIRDRANLLIVFSVLQTLIIFIIAFRGESVDKDYLTYNELFYADGPGLYIEVSFLIIRSIVKFIFGDRFILLIIIYAFLGVCLKFYGIKKMSNFWMLSILIYVSNIFIIQDLTQIRAGVCAGLLLISLIPLEAKKNLKFFLLAFIAILFHYSGLIILLFWFLDTQRINKLFWALVIPVCYIIYFAHFTFLNFLSIIPIESIQAKLNVYFLMQDTVDEAKVNVLNVLILLRIFLAYIFLYKLDFLYEKNKYTVLLTKIYIMSIGVLVFTADVSTIAFRLNELLSVSEIILLPLILYLFKPRLIGKVVVITFAAILLFFHFRAHTLLIF